VQGFDDILLYRIAPGVLIGDVFRFRLGQAAIGFGAEPDRVIAGSFTFVCERNSTDESFEQNRETAGGE
jgi:hypothetical protein